MMTYPAIASGRFEVAVSTVEQAYRFMVIDRSRGTIVSVHSTIEYARDMVTYLLSPKSIAEQRATGGLYASPPPD